MQNHQWHSLRMHATTVRQSIASTLHYRGMQGMPNWQQKRAFAAGSLRTAPCAAAAPALSARRTGRRLRRSARAAAQAGAWAAAQGRCHARRPQNRGAAAMTARRPALLQRERRRARAAAPLAAPAAGKGTEPDVTACPAVYRGRLPLLCWLRRTGARCASCLHQASHVVAWK